MNAKQRSTHDEIFAHLTSLLGEEANNVTIKSSREFTVGNKVKGMALLSEFDSKLGGFGIYGIKDERPLGIYRALFYVWLPLQGHQPDDFSRGMIHNACIYLEELLKKIARVWPWEEIKADGLPLGTLTRRAQKRLLSWVYEELVWLSNGVYNFAKHHYNLEDDEGEEAIHYFRLDEALAVYLIVRKLGLELESMLNRSQSS